MTTRFTSISTFSVLLLAASLLTTSSVEARPPRAREVSAVIRTINYDTRIRHPMYTFAWLLGIAQALLLWNWIVAVAGLASFALIYFQRVRHEERVMLDQCGEAYRVYMNRTGRIVPRWPLKLGREQEARAEESTNQSSDK